MELVPGTVVGRYVVEARLGAGAASSSYRARHQVLDTLHALTVPNPEMRAVHQRLVEGARIQARLRHPNVISATDVLDLDGIPVVVLDYVDGPNLEAYVGSHPDIDVDGIDALAAGLFDGLAWLHTNGVAHRHLKPRNVILDLSGKVVRPRLTDFMFSKAFGVTAPETRRGPKVFGTPAYMAPEQTFDSKSADHRADLWALGCVLYFVCTSRGPFDATTQEETFERVRRGYRDPLRRHVPSAPARWENAIRRCLTVDPDERGPTADAIAEEWFAGVAERPRLSSRVAPVGEVTLVFTDIQGSTKFWEQNPDLMRNCLRAHDALMRAAIGRHAGYEVKTEGDAFMIAFGDPVQAARFCLDVQRELYHQPWPDDLLAFKEASEGPGFRGIRVRMGIHTGEPEPRAMGPDQVDYYGPAVNRAARVGGAGHGGQIVVSAETWDRIEDHLREDEVVVRDLGTFGLKGLDGWQELVQILPPELAERTFPAVKAERQLLERD
jgi:class 3 adenylate cyclase